MVSVQPGGIGLFPLLRHDLRAARCSHVGMISFGGWPKPCRSRTRRCMVAIQGNDSWWPIAPSKGHLDRKYPGLPPTIAWRPIEEFFSAIPSRSSRSTCGKHRSARRPGLAIYSRSSDCNASSVILAWHVFNWPEFRFSIVWWLSDLGNTGRALVGEPWQGVSVDCSYRLRHSIIKEDLVFLNDGACS